MVSSRQQYRYCHHPTCLISILVSVLLLVLIVREHKINFDKPSSSSSSSLHHWYKINPKHLLWSSSINNNNHNNNSTNIINNVSSSAIVVSLESVTTINEKQEEEEKEENQSDDKNDKNKNNHRRWPILQQKLCPNGIPNVTLGPTLFQLARKEFGLIEKKTKKKEEKTKTKKETKTTDITNNNNNDDDDQNDENNEHEQNQHKFVNYFYKGGFGFTIYINENDPTNTILYVPIWKCANDQIHSYLHKVYNRQSNGHIRQHNNITSNSNATAMMMTLYNNDTYLENLKINDMKFLFHKQVQQKMNSNNNNNNSTSLINDNDNDDDENNIFFIFNNTNRSKPCLFTVLRDPISHFLSGYNEVEFRLIKQTNDSPPLANNINLAPYTKLPPFGGTNHNKNKNNNIDVTTTTSSINDSNNNETMMQQLEKRFIQFVQDVLEEHFSFYKYKFYKHFASMSRILPFLNDLNLLPQSTSTNNINNKNWYLSNLNNLTETFPTFLLNTCPNIGGRTTITTTSIMNDNNNNNNNNTSKGTLTTTRSNGDNDNEDVVDPTTTTTMDSTIMPNMEIKGLHKSSKDIYGTYQAAKNVWNSNSKVAKALCIIHSFDYACYDFSSGSDSSDGSNSGIPNICREVYESDLFYNGIILY